MNNTIRVERAVLRISQQQLAEKIGVSRQTINAIETGKYVPSAVIALKIASVFSKNVNDIFTLGDEDWIKKPQK
jgi:Predicted transcriptional regulators